MQPLRSADFSAAMRPILLVVCALHASHALQAPRPQCTTSLQTPRAAPPLRRRCAREPTSRNRGGADGAMARQPRARRRGTRSRLRQLPLGRRRARLHEISNSARAGAGLVGRRPPLPDRDLGAAPVRARGVDNRRHRRGREFTKAAAGKSRGAERAARRGRRRGVRGALRVLGAPRDGPRATDGGTRAVAPRAFALENKRPDAGLVRRRRGDGRGGPAIEVALLGGGGLFAEPFGHLSRLRPPDGARESVAAGGGGGAGACFAEPRRCHAGHLACGAAGKFPPIATATSTAIFCPAVRAW